MRKTPRFTPRQTAGRQGTSFISTAPTAAEQVATSFCTLTALRVYSDSAQYVQIHDVANAPEEAEVPILSFKLAAGETFVRSKALKLTTGLYICSSSTFGTKTLGATDLWVEADV